MDTSAENRCWDKWFAAENESEQVRAALLHAKSLHETYGQNEGYLEFFTAEELAFYKAFCQETDFLKDRPLVPLGYREIRYILPYLSPEGSIERRIFNKVLAYGKVARYKLMLNQPC